MQDSSEMEVAVLAALAEPSRLRIVELLAEAPRPVGEIAAALTLCQPQVTKNLQALERAGLVRVHPLGQRRIYALRREPLQTLAAWAGDRAGKHPSEDDLARYDEAVRAEQRRLQTDRGPRVVRLRRTVAARAEGVWDAWTQAELVQQWWSPRYFRVARCTVEPTAGGRLEMC